QIELAHGLDVGPVWRLQLAILVSFPFGEIPKYREVDHFAMQCRGLNVYGFFPNSASVVIIAVPRHALVRKHRRRPAWLNRVKCLITHLGIFPYLVPYA